MIKTNDTQAFHASPAIRPGLLDRLKANSGIRTDEAFAAAIGVSRATLARLKSGDEPNLRTVIGIAQAFGLGIGEVVEINTTPTTPAPLARSGATS